MTRTPGWDRVAPADAVPAPWPRSIPGLCGRADPPNARGAVAVNRAAAVVVGLIAGCARSQGVRERAAALGAALHALVRLVRTGWTLDALRALDVRARTALVRAAFPPDVRAGADP